ncbi:MAG: hypothetical protein LBV44_05375 [Methylobacillus sp.]|jgi:hypothetical protein|nr:hypothetical protein [Methylobacillus sp.]
MITIPPEVGRFIADGLAQEIKRQEEVFRTCGDDIPDDCDPNDVMIYVGYRNWLIEHSDQYAIDEHPNSKPTAWVMAMIPYFLKEAHAPISEQLLNAVMCTYAQYAAGKCLAMIKNSLSITELHHNASKSLVGLLERIASFPRRTDLASRNDDGTV